MVNPESSFCIAETVVNQLLHDADLLEEPDYHIIGDSGEFSYDHLDFYDYDFGVSVMTWNHTANNSITVDDCVYFQQSFNWMYTSEYPRSGYAIIEYAFDVSGDFDYSETMRNYVYFQVWLETPSGDTHHISGSRLPSAYLFENKTMDFGFSVGHAWDELVNDDSPSPNNIFNICVGFSPDGNFFYADTGLEPWQLYSGSVSLFVKSFEVVLTKGTPEDSRGVSRPIWENHWETSPQNKIDFPTDYPPILDRGIDDSCRGIILLDDDSIVSLVHTYYNDATVRFDDMVLQRWGPTCNLLWYRRVINFIPGALASDGESIYVAGTRNGNVFLSKWNNDGNLVWNNTWDFGLTERANLLAVDSEGSTYLYLEQYNNTGYPSSGSFLIKADKDGNEIWQKSLNDTKLVELYAGNGTSFFTHDLASGFVSEWDSEGNILSTITQAFLFRVDSNSLVTVDSTAFQSDSVHPGGYWNILVLNRTGLHGSTLWSKNLFIEYAPDYREQIYVYDIEITPDGSILLLLYLSRYAKEYRLYRYFENGTLDGFKIVGWMPLMGVWKSYHMIPSGDGLVYFYAHEYQSIKPNPYYPEYVRYYDLLNKIEAYNYTSYTSPFNPIQLVPYILVGAGAVILVGVISITRRKKTSLE